jgi:putative endonuclease
VDTRATGSRWERVAESFLNRRGLRTLERNYQCRFGEIDLVLLDGRTLVFAEVRYRARDSHGSGADSVTWTKRRRIVRTAARYLQAHCAHRERACRFDVVSIGQRRGRPEVRWIRSAFLADQ